MGDDGGAIRVSRLARDSVSGESVAFVTARLPTIVAPLSAEAVARATTPRSSASSARQTCASRSRGLAIDR